VFTIHTLAAILAFARTSPAESSNIAFFTEFLLRSMAAQAGSVALHAFSLPAVLAEIGVSFRGHDPSKILDEKEDF
jgi:hypothetical protein